MSAKNDRQGGPSRGLLAWFAAVVLGAFMVFNANFRELGLVDTVPATLLAASVVRDQDLRLDEYEPLLEEIAPGGYVTLRQQMEWSHAIVREKGHLRSIYPVGPALLAAPVYAIPVALGVLHRFHDYRVAAKLSASLIAALSAGVVFLCLLRFVERKRALFLTVVYALGTGVWTIASQALWQHGPALLCLSLGVLGALRLSERDDVKDALVVSAACGMAIVCRPQNIVAAAAIGAFALLSRPRRFVPLLLPAAVVGALLVAYDLVAFGNVSGGYEAVYSSPGHAFRHLTAKTAFTLPLREGLPAILVSPSRGLFVYSPVLAIAFIALALAAVRTTLARFLLGWVLVMLYFYGKNRIWWGGTSYGPRYMTELSLPLVLGLAMLWPRIEARRFVALATAALAVFGIAVQALGAFTWECGWHVTPLWADYRPERFWDFHDPEILRCVELLEEHGPRRPEFGPFAPAGDP